MFTSRYYMYQTVEHQRSPESFVVEFWVFIDWSRPNIPHSHTPRCSTLTLRFLVSEFSGTFFRRPIFRGFFSPGTIFRRLFFRDSYTHLTIPYCTSTFLYVNMYYTFQTRFFFLQFDSNKQSWKNILIYMLSISCGTSNSCNETIE